MERRKLEGNSSPLATSEDIQKRLVRPTPLNSQPSYSSAAASSPRCGEISQQYSSKLDLNSRLQKKSKEIKRLEDYLDPVLLSTIRPKIGAKRKHYGVEETRKITKTEELTKTESDWFEWPGDHHKLIASGGSSRRSRSFRVKHEDEIMDIELDSDSIGVGLDETEDLYCTPFQRFERAAMKQFKP